MRPTDHDSPIPAAIGTAVVLARPLDEFQEGTSARVSEADPRSDSYQLRVDARRPRRLHRVAFIEARRRDFLVMIEPPRPMSGYTELTWASGSRELWQADRFSLHGKEWKVEEMHEDEDPPALVCFEVGW